MLSGVVYCIDRDRKCIEFATTDVLSDKTFCESLTPFHMVYGKSFNGRCEIDVNDRLKGNYLCVQAKHTEIVLQHFFNCFYKEYILALLERHALQTSTRNSNNQ